MREIYLTKQDLINILNEPLKTNIKKIFATIPNFFVDDLFLISQNNKISNIIYGKKYNFMEKSDMEKLSFTTCMRCYIIKNEEILHLLSIKELTRRYLYKRNEYMAKDIARDIKEYNFIEKIEEELLPYSDDSLYNITSFGTDLTFREIITMYEENDLVKPDLQRNYVWSKNEASRFIDSILLGLPVPSIFLAKAQDGRRLIVDGFQRIMTVYDYIKGVFRGDGKVFKLSKSETVNARWRGKAYTELTAEEQRNIKLSPIHAIIFEQKEPQDDTGMYQIFERINTGGRVLKPQEIRNCIYHGKFNETLKELNKEKIWRIVLGNPNEEARMFDIELILRFFAFSYIKKYFRKNKISQISLIKYLNEYMSLYSNASENDLSYMRKIFKKVIKFLNEKIGDNVFRTFKRNDNVLKFANKINPVVFDSISAATVFVLENNKININKIDNLYDKYISLLENIDYINITKVRTTNVENIKKRISIACDVLYGVQYEW